MNKKFISAALAGVMMLSTAAIAASADEVTAEPAGATAEIVMSGDSGKIRFDMGDWNHDDRILCYMWATKEGEPDLGCTGGVWEGAPNWGTKKNKMTPVEGEDGIVESFEFEMPDDSWNVFVIFHDSTTGAQTFDNPLTAECFGDTAVRTGEMLENPVDSEKKGERIEFQNTGLTAALTLTSSGQVQGSYVFPNTNRPAKVAKWILNYQGTTEKLSGAPVVTKDTVANAVSAFETTNEEVFAEYQKLENVQDSGWTAEKQEEAKTLLDIKDEEKKDDEKKDDEKKDDTKSNTSSNGSTASTTSTASKAGTTTTTKTTTSTAAATGTASTEAAAATGDTTGTAAFAVVLVAAAAAMILARKKVEE